MVIVAGIDEAGRGPVCGPMVMAIVAVSEEQLDLLSELGVRDSKKIS
ncbi:MAG: ribonuclease HII, partial [Candidatus Helarchaeales archaeon]